MNVLLVYPQYPDTFWSFKHVLRYISKKAAYPPLGLLTVAALLPKDWNQKLVDTNVSSLKESDIAWADMVFVSAMLVQKTSAQEIITRCKAQGKTVVAGGPVFTTQHDHFTGVDHFILNEAEVTLPLFLEDLKNHQAKPLYASEIRPDITKTPIPLWSLLKLKDYAAMSVQYSRGCPYKCEFCDIVIMNGRIPRTKTPEQIVREFQALYDAGWRRSVFVVDDNFIGNKISVKETLRVLAQWQKEHNFPFSLMTEASVDLAADEELLQLMSAANFHKVFLGLETPSATSLKECEKVQNTKTDLSEAVKTIHQHGLQVMGGFIVGFDSDTEKIFDQQINFIQKIGVVTAMVGMLTALPKTRLWNRLKTEGRLVSNASGDNTDGILNFIPQMGAPKLVEGYKKIISTIFTSKKYYERISAFVKNYKPRVRGKIHPEDVMAFVKSIWSIGILSSSRWHYWKLLVKTSLTNFKALPVVVELAICGLHYQKCARKLLENLGVTPPIPIVEDGPKDNQI